VPSRRRRSRRSLGTKISYMNNSVVRSAQTSVPTQFGEQSITGDSLVQGAVSGQYISPSAVDATKFSLSARLPSGEGTQRVPAPLTDRTYWAQVVAGDIELHNSGIHGEDGKLEDIVNVASTNSGLYFTPTATDAARIYLTGRMPIPQSRKIYATWNTDSANLDFRLIWWKSTPILDVETAKIEQGVVQLGLSTNTHGLVELDTIQINDVGPDFDGIYTVLKTSGNDIYYVPTIDSVSDNIISATYTASTATATVNTAASGGFNGALAQDGVVYVDGLGAPFDGMFVVKSVDSEANAISYAVDYSSDVSLVPSGGATVRLYPADTSLHLNDTFLAPTGKVSKDEYVYVPLQDREIWGADGYTVRLQSYSLTNNVASVVAYNPTYLRAGDTVTIAGIDASGAATDIFDGEFTVTSVSADSRTFSYATTSANVSSTVLATASYAITQNQDTPRDYAVYVEMPASATDTGYLYGAKVFEVLGEAKTQPAYAAVSKASLTNNVATLVVPDPTVFSIDSEVTVSGIGTPYDGTFTVEGVGSATVYGYEVVNNIIYLAVSNTTPFITGVNATVSGTADVDGTYSVSATEVSNSVTAYSVVSNVVTLTLAVGANVYGYLNSHVFVSNVHSSLNSTSINYLVTSVNAGSRTLTFSATVSNVSGSCTGTASAKTLKISNTKANVAAVVPVSASVKSNTISYPVPATANVASASVTGLAIGYSGVEHSELTPTGLTLYNADGSIAARLSSQDVNTLSIGNADTGQATISDTGEGTFTDLAADSVLATDLNVGGDFSVSGASTFSGPVSAEGGTFFVDGNLSSQNITASANISTSGFFKQSRRYNNSQIPYYWAISFAGYTPFISALTLYFEAPQRWAKAGDTVYFGGGYQYANHDIYGFITVYIPGGYMTVTYAADFSINLQYQSGYVYVSDLAMSSYAFAAGYYGYGGGTTYIVNTSESLDVFKTTEAARYNRVVGGSGTANTNTISWKYYDGEVLDRFSRGVVYHVGWDGPGPTIINLNAQFTTFAAGSFYLENNRSYLFNVNFGHTRVVTHANVNLSFELLFSTSAINLGASGVGLGVVSHMITNNTLDTSGISIPPFTFGAYSTPNAITNGVSGGVAQGGVPIYWAIRASSHASAFTNTQISSNGYTTDLDGPSFTIYDMGQHKSIGKLDGSGYGNWANTGTTSTSTTTTNTNAATTTTTTYTKTAILQSSSSAYFDAYGLGDGGTADQYANEQSLYQGNPGTSSGTKKSQVAFPAVSSLADYTKDNFAVTKVELYIKNRHSYSGSGLTFYYGLSTDTSARNSSAPPAPISGAGVGTKAFTKGQGQYITLSTTMANYFANNTARSVLVGLTSASSNTYYSSLTNYGYFDGDLQADPPKLRITYTYTVTA
jgi:hypothetical protein